MTPSEPQQKNLLRSQDNTTSVKKRDIQCDKFRKHFEPYLSDQIHKLLIKAGKGGSY